MPTAVAADPTVLANRLRPVLLQLNRQLRREIHSLGVTGGQVSLLVQIKFHPGIGIRELAALERMSVPGMSKFISRLEEAGLVQRAPVEGDQRRVGLTLTPAGHKVLRSVKSKRTAWLAARLRDLDPERARGDRRGDRAARTPARGGRVVTAAILRAGARTFLSVRKHRNYRLFFTGQVISNIGTWMQRVAQAWLVLSLTHSPVAVGILALCQFMPFTLFSLIAGVVVDRLDAWRTVISTQFTQMVLASTIAVIALAGVARPWHVYVIAALMGLVQVLDAPSRQQLTFRMVGPLELPNAISLNSGVFNGARIFGPGARRRHHRRRGRGRLLRRQRSELHRRARRPADDAPAGVPFGGTPRARPHALHRSQGRALLRAAPRADPAHARS